MPGRMRSLLVSIALLLTIIGLAIGTGHSQKQSPQNPTVKQEEEKNTPQSKKEEVVKEAPKAEEKPKVDTGDSSLQPKVDARVTAIDAYFSRNGMPLAGQGYLFVKYADKYGIDWRLLAAISVKESSGGKFLPYVIRPDGTRYGFNAFGWTCNRSYLCYSSWEEAIEFVSRQLGTHRYYAGKDTYGKLYVYNGTVEAQYPNRVIAIMNQIGH